MRIRSELVGLVSACIVLCGGSVGLVLTYANQVVSMNNVLAHMRGATRDITSQLALTQEISHYGSQRATTQWKSLHDGLRKKLDVIAIEFPKRDWELSEIQETIGVARQIFDQLQTVGPGGPGVTRSKREEFLIDLLTIQIQGAAEDFYRISDQVAVERAAAQHRMVLASIAGSVSLLLFSIAIALSLRWRVLGPIANLKSVTREFGAGSLDKRATAFRDDEMGNLAGQFNLMADRLQKQAEELKSANDGLEEKIAQRTDDLQRTTDEMKLVLVELQARTLAQERLIHILSHDLREPLNGILNFTRMITVTQGDRLDGDGHKQFAFVTRAAARMKTLLDDLLKYVRLEKNEITPVPIRLDQLMTEVGDDLLALIETNGASLKWEADMTIHGDRSLLRLVVENLVSNAIKFHKPGVAPKVFVQGTETETESVICVSDNGIGVPPADFERIFELFARLHLREKFEGTGLGLAIVKRIVEMHGGSIGISSSEAGSRFAVHLPKLAQQAGE